MVLDEIFFFNVFDACKNILKKFKVNQKVFLKKIVRLGFIFGKLQD